MDSNYTPNVSQDTYGFTYDKNLLIGKYGLKLSELFSEKELTEILTENYQNKKKYDKNYNYASDTAQFQSSLSVLRDFFSKASNVKSQWEQYKNKYKHLSSEQQWSNFISETEGKFGNSSEVVKDIQNKYNLLKDLKSNAPKKSIFARFYPFSKKTGGKKRSRKTKKRRR